MTDVVPMNTPAVDAPAVETPSVQTPAAPPQNPAPEPALPQELPKSPAEPQAENVQTPASDAQAGQSGDLIGDQHPAEPEQPKQETQPQSGVPDHYEQFFDVSTQAGESGGKAFNFQLGELARANGWSQDTAKKNFEQMGQILESYQHSIAQQWKAETLADPEIGGANWPKTQALANRAFSQFLTDSERALLRSNGAINNKDVIRLLARIGERISMDTAPAGLHNGLPSAPQKPQTLRDFYSKYDIKE